MKKLIHQIDNVTITLNKKRPPEYLIAAQGKTSTAGWSKPELSAVVYVQAPLDGIYDFDFLAEPPSGPSEQALTAISAHRVLKKKPRGFRGVRVHATSNTKEARF